jgi:hypothetical protein
MGAMESKRGPDAQGAAGTLGREGWGRWRRPSPPPPRGVAGQLPSYQRSTRPHDRRGTLAQGHAHTPAHRHTEWQAQDGVRNAQGHHTDTHLSDTHAHTVPELRPPPPIPATPSTVQAQASSIHTEHTISPGHTMLLIHNDGDILIPHPAGPMTSTAGTRTLIVRQNQCCTRTLSLTCPRSHGHTTSSGKHTHSDTHQNGTWH